MEIEDFKYFCNRDLQGYQYLNLYSREQVKVRSYGSKEYFTTNDMCSIYAKQIRFLTQIFKHEKPYRNSSRGE